MRKSDQNKTVGIILASGAGERFGANVPKQFLTLNGKMVATYAIETFKRCDLIDHVIVVCHGQWLDIAERLGADEVVPGGATRNESTYNGLEACPPGTTKVLTHDAVRPFVDDATIRRCVEALDQWPAVDTCIPSADTIIEIDGQNIADIPPRHCLRRGQTPQAFDYQSILSAYRYVDQRDATDDITIAIKFGLKCGVVEGSIWNIKITEPQDLFVAERIMQYRDATVRQPLVKGKNILLFGGSGGIGRGIIDQLRSLGAAVTAPTRQEVDLGANALPPSLFDGQWDCIIHCAGVLIAGTKPADYETTMNVNLRSAVLVADLAEKTMPKGGNVVFVGSSSAMKGRAFAPFYSASKAALNNFTEGIAEALADKGICVNCVNPGQTLTPMLADAGLPSDQDRALSVEHVVTAIISYCDTEQTGQIVNIRKNVDGAE